MSDAPPPAYSAVDTGENVSPPAYNEQAPAVPPAYNPSAPAIKPTAPSQPAVKYVDQNGNPVNPPPNANVKYVDQNGNPVNPPPNANVKYVDQHGNPVNPPPSAQIQPKPAVKYVDQYGNPVNPPNANVKYVDQYGNPVAAPKTAPVASSNIKYVDQNGNPVNPPPSANVKYVDQNGNPVNPPTQQPSANVKYVDQYGNPVNAPPTQQPAANVKYVDQYGNPVAPPTTATTNAGVTVASGAPGTRTMTQSVKQQKIASTVLGGIATVILFIGLCVNSLASGTSWSSIYYDITYTCGWTELSVDCGDSYSYSYGGSSCTDTAVSYGDYCELEQQYGSDGGGPSWCGTQTSAALSLVTMLTATILCGIAVIFVQPWCKVTACCCKSNPNCGCARVCFVISLIFSVLTLIIWLAGDEVCLGEGSTSVDMGIGGSIICNIIGMIFVIISASLAK